MISKPVEEQIVPVVKDDPNALDLLGRALQEAGMRVVAASDGQVARIRAMPSQPEMTNRSPDVAI